MATSKIFTFFEIVVPLSIAPFEKIVRRHKEDEAFQAYDKAFADAVEWGCQHLVKLRKVTQETLLDGVPRVKRVARRTTKKGA